MSVIRAFISAVLVDGSLSLRKYLDSKHGRAAQIIGHEMGHAENIRQSLSRILHVSRPSAPLAVSKACGPPRAGAARRSQVVNAAYPAS